MLGKRVALLPVFNDARYLPGWLDAVGANVDAVVALDDGSTDESLEILSHSAHVTRIIRILPEEKTGWNEPRNREVLVTAGQELGADWFIAFDADERPATRLWEQWQELTADADQRGAMALNQPLREVWDQPDSYRSDGLWGKKRKAAIFRNLGQDHQFDPAPWHGEWYPIQHRDTETIRDIDIDLYHLKMLNRADRYARMERYRRLDPQNEHQAIGYDYLVDEAELQLTRIPAARRYHGMLPDESRLL